MTLSVKQQREHKLGEIERALAQARFLHLVPRVLIHEPAPPGAGRCPCCKSEDAAIVEERPQPEVVIDVATGRRIRPGDVSQGTWSKVTAAADRHDIPLRMSRTQADLVFCDAPFRIASGGNRAAKTYAGLVHVALEWLNRGGPDRLYWLCASTNDTALKLLRKMFVGTGEAPPVLPRALVRTMPESPRATDKRTILADGSVFDLRAYHGDPGAERAKSDSVVAVLCDEAAHVPTVDWITALRGRTLQTGGTIWFASTPRPGSVLREFVDNALAFERLPADDPERVERTHPGSLWVARSFPIASNPWLPRANIEAQMKSLDMNDPSVQRDWLGLWTTSGGLLWRAFSEDRHVVVDPGRTVAAMQATLRERVGTEVVDITERVAAQLTARPNPHVRAVQANNRRYIIGSDFNCHPMSSVILQVFAPKGAEHDRDKWHVLVHDSPVSSHSNALAHAERLVDPAWVRVWDPMARTPPFLNCLMICDPTALGRDPTAHKHGRDPGGLAATLALAGFDARAPSYRFNGDAWKPVHLPRYDTHLLLHRLLKEGRLLISARALALKESLLNQEDSGDGITPYVKSHTKSDERAGVVDATRYACHGIFFGGQAAGGKPAPGSLPRVGSLPGAA